MSFGTLDVTITGTVVPSVGPSLTYSPLHLLIGADPIVQPQTRGVVPRRSVIPPMK
jgi:hypothetical protein